MSEAKVELGRALFYDTRLSGDGTMSCGTCHRQELAFTDGQARPTGITGERHPRSAMSLANVAYAVSLAWDDPALRLLEQQLTTPIFGHDPVEMGVERSEHLLARLRSDWLTVLAFQAAFGASDEDAHGAVVTMDRVAKAIAAFERTLISGNSAFDRYFYQDDEQALSPEARRGMALFFSKRLSCGECHRGFNLSGPFHFEGSREHEPAFHNTGLYAQPGPDGPRYPAHNPGLRRHTGNPKDDGRFKAPTLRNIAVTAPYMHDGSIADLEGVIDHYARGGRADHPLKSSRLRGFTLSPSERHDLIAFLHALTDPSFLSNPDFGPPNTRP